MAQTTKQLEEALLEAKTTIEAQAEALRKLTSPPLSYGTIIALSSWKDFFGVEKKTLQVSSGGGSISLVEAPAEGKFSVGQTIVIHPMTSAIVGHSKEILPGATCVVSREIDDFLTEVELQGNSLAVFHGPHKPSLKPGDSVLLDRSNTSIVKKIVESRPRFSFDTETGVTWDMIGGLTEAKRQIRDAIELPRLHPEIFSHYNVAPCKGMLFFGPPGCGKTMLGKAIASSLGSKGFMYVKGPEILEKYVGMAEATIRAIFSSARRFHLENNQPAVVFIDEADAILSRRGSGVSSDMEKTIVPMFLSEMDGLSSSSALIILTTNREDQLDPAVIRDGRIDKKIRISRPLPPDAFSILEYALRETPLQTKHSPASLADLATKELFSKSRILYTLHEESGKAHAFMLSDIINGAMARSVVEQAKITALHRDLSSSTKTGVCPSDILHAVSSIESQNRQIEHTDDITDFVKALNRKIARIQRFSLEEHRAGAKAKA